MFPIWLASVAQGLAQQEKDAQARRDEATKISSQFSGSMGMPQYQLEAAQTNRDINQGPGMDFLKMYLNQKGSQGGSGGGMMGG